MTKRLVMMWLAGAVLTCGPAANGELLNVQKIATISTTSLQDIVGVPAMNDQGQVTYLEGYPVNTVYRTDGVTTVTIATFGAPGFTGIIPRFPVNSSGLVLVEGTKGGRDGLWTGSGGGDGGLTIHYESNVSVFSDTWAGGMNGSGKIAFGGKLVADGSSGVYLGDGSTNGSDLVPIAHESDPLFGGTFLVGLFSQEKFAPLDVNNGGDLVFRAALAAGGEGLFIGNGAGYTLIADTNTAGGIFGGFDGIALSSDRWYNLGATLNETGQVVFRATLTAGGEAVYLRDTNGQLSLIADTSGAYAAFYGTAINDSGSIVFEAKLGDGTIGFFTGGDPVASKLVAIGDTLDGKTVSALKFGDLALNNNDQIGFYAGFSNGSQGIYRATIPEPATLSLLALGACLPLLRRRR